MDVFGRLPFQIRDRSATWNDCKPVREELFGPERLEQHGKSLAIAQVISSRPPQVSSLHRRLNDNAKVLLAAYRASARELEQGRGIVPAAEWLLDNYHLVEEQIREIRQDLPPGYYRQLPKLSNGPFAGYPRVFDLAWAYVAHTDSHFDPHNLYRFINAFQSVQSLTIGELWAVAITLRIVLIENLRRLADQITLGRAARKDADALTVQLLKAGCSRSALEADIASRTPGPLSEPFAAHLAKGLREQDPNTTPALEWLDQRLTLQGSSVDEVVQHAQRRQGASNVSVRNVITSMRLISAIDWADLIESVSLVDKRLRERSAFATMDFPTRNLYRNAVEQLARGSEYSELEIVDHVLDAAQKAALDEANALDVERVSDAGFHLLAEGRRDIEQSIHYRSSPRQLLSRLNVRLGLFGYVGAIVLLSTLLLTFAYSLLDMSDLSLVWTLAFLIIASIPASEISIALVNRGITWSFGATSLPALELKTGVPSSLRTLLAVPTLLTSESDLLEQVERLEVHFLSGAKGDLCFALLADGLDADQEVLASDSQLLSVAAAAIAALNQRHSNGPSGPTFLLLYRRRIFNPSENKWMGWERKRGKLNELNRLLRGATDTTFISLVDENLPGGSAEPLSTTTLPSNVRYVIVLDADTRLPRDAAQRLIGKMAHPLNRPQFCKIKQRVVGGYGILQPRVTPSLPIGSEGSLYQRIFSSPGGIDPYAAAISDVYQDLFNEGSFTGKGIYDVDAFENALADRVPENAMLSHDLFEGIFARAGLASDIEVVEDFPSRYDVIAKRQHRWTRGDWQLLGWLFSFRRGAAAVPCVGRWKMFDNLRRSLVAPFTLLSLGACWLLPTSLAVLGVILVLASMVIPTFLFCLFSIVSHRKGVSFSNHMNVLRADLQLATAQFFLSLAFLPDQAWRMGDAIGRTLLRLFITHKHLLQWTTAAQSQKSRRLNLSGFYQHLSGGTVLALCIAIIALILTPTSWLIILPFVVVWLAAPALALWSSSEVKIAQRLQASEIDALQLRLTARRTWRYFETFVTAEDNMLPPDNFQEDPEAVIAHRTSPTNIGLYLLSAVAARDFGWAGTITTIDRIESCFATLQKLTLCKGHFFNWYGTRELQPLQPAYVSSVDSGNLAGHLIVLANACEEWCISPLNSISLAFESRLGMQDNVHLAREANNALRAASGDHGLQLAKLLDDIESKLTSAQATETLLPILNRLTEKATNIAQNIFPNTHTETKYDSGPDCIAPPLSAINIPELIFWIEALLRTVQDAVRDHSEIALGLPSLKSRLNTITTQARDWAMGMDFKFLLDPDRKLLSIGYSHTDNSLDESCYDLLASEARLASLFAIAKGDVSTRHWFRLGRTATPIGMGSALISWSGSMFEYLMPSLVMRAPAGSLLEQTNRLVVKRQQDYARGLKIPWGISESAYNARDIEFTYQYSNFGIPGLGLKRGLAENVVLAPYATGLATMVDPHAAQKNYQALTELGALGRYGFYEAIDFTRTRLPDTVNFVLVRNFMAHHQAMTIVAIANCLHAGQMRARFHQEPMIQACELLLQERLPRNVLVSHPRAEEVKIAASEANTTIPAVRKIWPKPNLAPETHLLSNGRYTVMLSAAGAGFSVWRDIAITRWREDATCDNWGSFVFLRDMKTGKRWSTCVQPCSHDSVQHDPVVFGEDHAEFSVQENNLTTTMDVLVSGEDDGEVRRISLTNRGNQARDIELTSYTELVLTKQSSDAAHPAFAKLFVVTEYLPEFSALIATRRLRSHEETPIWAAHFAVIEGAYPEQDPGYKQNLSFQQTLSTQTTVQGQSQTEFFEPEYETDRAEFLGRNRDLCEALAISSEINSESQDQVAQVSTSISNTAFSNISLSNTVGTVLDPIFSLRYRIVIPPGKVRRVAFWTVVASSRAELLDLIDKHHDHSAYERALTLAWTQAQVQLRHLDIDSEEAADFQRLAAPIIYADARFRAPASAILRGAGAQSGLWPLGISGDLPIVLLHVDNIEDMARVSQLLRAHEYWRMKQLAVDLVIINEHASSYMQDLQIAIETALRSSESRPRYGQDVAQGSVYTLRADLMTLSARELLQSVARVVLVARRGSVAEQLSRIGSLSNDDSKPLATKSIQSTTTSQMSAPTSAPTTSPSLTKYILSPLLKTKEKKINTETIDLASQNIEQNLEMFNGIGGFASNGTEYVTILKPGLTTPAPWLNVIANSQFGFQVTAEGSAYTWAENSRENQLTPWSNDPVSNPSGECIFIRDENSLDISSPTAHPIRDQNTYIARHGFGYSSFEHQAQGIQQELLQFVPLKDPIKISRLRLHNVSGRSRRFTITVYAEWVLGTVRGASAPFITTEMDSVTGAMFARNTWSNAFPGRVAFADLAGRQSHWTADRTEFLGRHGSITAPASLNRNQFLSGAVGAGYDPCSALQCVVEIETDETIDVVWFVGQCGSNKKAQALITRYRDTDLDAVLNEVKSYWASTLGAVQVKTPNRAMDIMLNGWLLYQTLACRITARSAFYQASGAYGFRDQLQDGMSLTFSNPAATRQHLLRAAGRQFPEGDVQHWWLPQSGQGVRTRISDDRVWLAYATATYIRSSGDKEILDKVIPFLDGPLLTAGEHDAFFQPMVGDESVTLFEHCARGIEQCLQLTGELGLPLIGTGDWNDGMNRVGEQGKGESVWLAWLLLNTIDLFAPYAELNPETISRAEVWRAHSVKLKLALEKNAWDGEWYRRATFDDGTWLGSKNSDECKIDSIAQSWAVLSGAADPQRAQIAMASVQTHLIHSEKKLALLFTPAFDQTEHEPGYIKGYPPGLRENGGQYTHAAMWAILAFAKLKQGDSAAALFNLLNPINHALNENDAHCYKVEPYVVAADVYSHTPHVGRGGWTWYTGAAGWMYRAGLEGILGLRREGKNLVIDPCIPSDWPEYSIAINVDNTRYDIRVFREQTGVNKKKTHSTFTLDGVVVSEDKIVLDGGEHQLEISLSNNSAVSSI